VPFLPEAEWIGAEPAHRPEEDIVSLISELMSLGQTLSPDSGVPLQQGREPREVSEASDPPATSPYDDVRDAAARLASEGDNRRDAASRFRGLEPDVARASGFRVAQEAALQSYAEHERLLSAEAAAFAATESTLSVLCDNVTSARTLATATTSEIHEIRGIAQSIDRWWVLTNAIRSELARRHPDFPVKDYPLNEFPDLGWQGLHLRLEYDRGVPVQNGARALHRIDKELRAVNELAAFVDAQLASDVAKSALVFVQAVYDATAPACGGEADCLSSLQADLIAAQGDVARAEGRRSAARSRFEVTLDEVNTRPAFYRQQEAELDSVTAHMRRLSGQVAEIRALVDTALAQATRSCTALAVHISVPLPCISVRIDPVPPGSSTTPYVTPGWGSRDHVFRLFNSRVAEPEGYAAYTYVLFPKRRGAWNESEQTRSRYQAVLKAIVDNTDSASEVARPRDELNLFAIPTELDCEPDQSDGQQCDSLLTNPENARELENYAPALARKYLAEARGGHLLRPEILAVIRDAPGPFLVTTPEPLLAASQSEGYGPLLFLDLTHVDPGAYTDYVNAYKRTIVDDPPSGQVIWEAPLAQRFQSSVLSLGRAFPKLLDAFPDLGEGDSDWDGALQH